MHYRVTEQDIIQIVNDWDEEWRIPETEPEKETKPKKKYQEEEEQGEQGNGKEDMHEVPPPVGEKRKEHPEQPRGQQERRRNP
jgi:hypothetical protein